MAQQNSNIRSPPMAPNPGFSPGPNTLAPGPPARMPPPLQPYGSQNPPPNSIGGMPYAGKLNSPSLGGTSENDGQFQKPPLTSNGDVRRPFQNGPYRMQNTAPNNSNGLNNYSNVNGVPSVTQPNWIPQELPQSLPGIGPLNAGGPPNISYQPAAPTANTPYSYSSVPSTIPGTKPDGVQQQPYMQQPYQNAPPGSISRTSSQGLLQTSSEPNSARSSRNPSPLPNRSYDSMEGQFPSPRPSPVNSSSNLQSLAGPPTGPLPPNAGMSPATSVPSTFPSIPPPPNTTTQYRPMVPPSYMAHPGAPITHQPPITAQSQTSQGPPPPLAQPLPHAPMAPAPSSQRPRYPQQTGYSQSSYPTPSSQTPTMTQTNQPYGNNYSGPNYANAPGPQMSVPDGPVGGVPGGYDPQLHARMAGMSVHNSFSRMWGNDSVNLLQDRHILPPTPVHPPKPILPQEKANCSPDIFRCTLTKVPENSSLLQKSRLPLGILIHPFKDISHLPVIQCNTIVRCRSCRTYINPFVSFVDQRRWKCNLCYRINDLPEEFFFDPASGTFGDPTRRPEIKNATIEFIAPSEYMLRPPQPAIYLFLLDVSHAAVETGYLSAFCQILLEEIDNLPGDARTRLGIITYDSSIHFYSLCEGMTRPHMMVVSDIDEMFVPLPDNLLVNLYENKTLLQELLTELPVKFAHNDDTNSALGAALQAAFKMVSPVGGRVTVMQSTLPNIGPGALKPREDPNQRAAKDVNNQCLGPASDFYKKLALDCSGQQVAVDLFLLSTQYADIATLACVSKFSSGCMFYYPGYHGTLNKVQVERYENDLRRYFTRKIGFEAVMRIRCTRGLSIHTFHGNFFVRSTDLLSLPNINPDNGFGMQISIEENLTESNVVCFQAAVLYTSSKGERRIRVHTLSLPVSPNLTEILGGADQHAIVGLLSKMAVDRSITASLSDARDALINACIDILSAFKATLPASQTAGALMSPFSVRLVPLYAIALLKHPAFRVAVSTKLDDRVFAMEQMKTLPTSYLLNYIYPNLYPVHALDDNNALNENDVVIPQPPLLQLSFEKVDRHGAYLLDTLECMYLYIGRAISDHFCANVLGVPNYHNIQEGLCDIPELESPENNRLRTFASWILSQRPFHAPLMIIREDSKMKHLFVQHMHDDRSESSFSYYEFLQHLKQQVSK